MAYMPGSPSPIDIKQLVQGGQVSSCPTPPPSHHVKRCSIHPHPRKMHRFEPAWCILGHDHDFELCQLCPIAWCVSLPLPN